MSWILITVIYSISNYYQGIRSLISYEGSNAQELISDFHGAFDDYLALCEQEGSIPEVAYKGSFNVRFKNKDNHQLNLNI